MNEQVKKFSASDFNADKYVKEISQVCVGGQELLQHKAKIQALAEETSQTLKKNVYQNYMQFIETAREISHLEGEMYQLSHLLGEQRALLGSMGSTGSGPGPQTLGEEEVLPSVEDLEAKRLARLAAITERVDSCISLVEGGIPGRDLVHEDNLVELDPLESTALHRCHAFLLSDLLIIATWISNRRGPAKYKFEASYEVSSLAVVNVRDLAPVRHAFKLLVFPDTRLFQCPSAQAKADWLEKLEQVKKARVSGEKVREKPQQKPESPVRAESVESANIFVEENDTGEWEVPDWVLESAEDLDVITAQRHFEEAYALAERTRAYLQAAPPTPLHAEIKKKVESRVNSLIEVLLSELRSCNEKSLQGGLRAYRRGVRLLNHLGKSTQACELYLKVCSQVVRAGLKRVKREGATLAYTTRLCSVFFSSLASVTLEFQHTAFPDQPNCASAFVVWASMEVSQVTSHLLKQVFMPQTPLSTLAQCVDVLRKHCEQLCELGVDLCYQTDGQLVGPLRRALSETSDKLVDAVKLRASEDTWRRSSAPPLLHKLQDEFSAAGLPSPKAYVTRDGWFELTPNTLAFTKMYCGLLNDALLLWTPDLSHSLDQVLYQVADTHLKHVAASLKLDRLQPQRGTVETNGRFLMEGLVQGCSKRYKAKTGINSKALEKLQAEYGPTLLAPPTRLSSVTGYI